MKFSFTTTVKYLIIVSIYLLTSSCNSGGTSPSNSSNNPINSSKEYIISGMSNNGVYQTLIDSSSNLSTNIIAGNGTVSANTNGVLAIATDSNNNVFAAGNSYVYQNINSQWVVVNQSSQISLSNINTLIITPNDNLYISTYSYNGNQYQGTIWKSHDGTWESITTSPSHILALANDNNNYIYAISTESFYSSATSNWSTPINESGSTILNLSALAVGDNNIFISGCIGSCSNANTVYESIAGHWESINGGFPNTTTLDSIALYNSQIFVGTHNGNSALVYESINGVWESVNSASIPDRNNAKVILAVNQNGLYTSTTESTILYESQNGVWQSVGNSSAYGGGYISTLFANATNLYTGSSYGNAFGFSDGWINLTTGGVAIESNAGSVVSVVVNKKGIIYSGVNKYNERGANVFAYTNNNWVPNSQPIPQNYLISQLATYNDDLYVATNSGYVYLLNNGQWELVNSSIVDSQALTSLIVDESDNIFTGSRSGFVYESVAGVWESVNSQPLPTSEDNYNTDFANVLAIDHNNNLFIGTENGYVYESAAGQWESISSGNTADGSAITSLAIDSNNNLFAGTRTGYVYESANGSWLTLNNNIIPDVYYDGANSLTIDSNNNLFLGTSYGFVYESVAGGWQTIYSANLGNSVNSMAVLYTK